MCTDRYADGAARRTLTSHHARGLTLIELVIFIAVVSIGVAGILSMMNLSTRHSADPFPQKQALAMAESMLEEIMLQPFTYCDPDDANAATATSTADCASQVEQNGPEPGETRYAEPYFDNVNDYAGFSMGPANGGVRTIANDPQPLLSAYTVSVAIAPAGASLGLPANDALEIQVRVTGPVNTDVTLTGIRTRYAPAATP